MEDKDCLYMTAPTSSAVPCIPRNEAGFSSRPSNLLSNQIDEIYRYSLRLAKNDNTPSLCDGLPLSQKGGV